MTRRLKNRQPGLVALIVFWLMAGTATAGTIPVANFSFESPVQATGTFSASITSWSGSGSGVFRGAQFGQNAVATDGDQIAYMNETNGQIYQTLGVAYQPGLSYTMVFDVSARSLQSSDDDFLAALYRGTISGSAGLTGNTVRSVVFKSATGVTNDQFKRFAFSAAPGQVSALGASGQLIGVGLFNNGGTTGGTSDYDFDNVRLFDSTGLIELPDPAIIGHGSEHSADYVAENVFDHDYSGALGSEFSSSSGGTSFLVFDFGTPVNIDGFDFAQRANDNDTLYGMSLTFSMDPVFGDAGDSMLNLIPTDFNEGATTTLERFVFPRQTARYVHWEAGTGQSLYRGAAEMAFLTVPEPAGAVLLLVGLALSLAVRRGAKRRS